MYLSRIQLTRALLEQTQLRHVLCRDKYGMHQLLWDLYPDGQYLFREENSNEHREENSNEQLSSSHRWPMFYVLSPKPPEEDSPLFQLDCKPFNPILNIGDRLAFHLRANPTIARRRQGKKNSARHDVVMDAKYQHLLQNCSDYGLLQEADIYVDEEEGRRSQQPHLNRKQLQQQLFTLPAFKEKTVRDAFWRSQSEAVEQASINWLAKRGDNYGFKLEQIQASGYLWHSLNDPKKNRNAGYSSMDYQGILRITNVEVFVQQLLNGFGSSKRFGCGLMLIRRV